MKIKIDYNGTEVSSHDCDIAPAVGDFAEVKNPEGDFTDTRVISRTFDFRDSEVVLRIAVAPLKTETPK